MAKSRNGSPVKATFTRGHLFMVVVAIVCGLGGGLGAVALRWLILTFEGLFFGRGAEFLHVIEGVPWYWRLLAPAIGGAIVGPLVHFVASEAKGHGVPEVMEAIMRRGGAIRPRVVVVKALASAITIGSGGSVGREGPIVQIGSALGSTIGQVLRLSASQLRTLVGCGAAAGIAAAFNAPIAGALFAVEILLGDFDVPQFSPIVISSVVATVVSRYFLGDFPAFVVQGYELVSPFELMPYAFLGVISGLVALAFITVLYGSEKFFEGVRIPEYLKAPIGGLAVGLIGVWLPQVFGVGYDTINAALSGALPAALLGTLLIAKIGATSLTLASGGSGGVFAPSLFLGAMTGGFVGTFIHSFMPTLTASSGAYALVAMGAVVAAATHAPITAIIIIFELTGDYRIIPPLMTACVISTLVATKLRRDSIYTLKLRLRGLDPFKKEEANVLKGLFVRDVIDREPEVIPESTNFMQMLDLVVSSTHSEFFVVDNNGSFLGSVSLAKLRTLIFQRDTLSDVVVARDVLEESVPRITEDDDLDVVMRLFGDGQLQELAVIDPARGDKVVGSVHRHDVINARNQEHMRRDLAGSLSSTISLVGKVRQVDIGDGYVIQEVMAPYSLSDRTLEELAVGAQHGVQVIFLRSRHATSGAGKLSVPRAGTHIREGDTLIVAGPKVAVDALAAL
jgi:CIC family chloride channel protein